MTSYLPPRVLRESVDSMVIWALSGDWTRDLPTNIRHDALAELANLKGRAILDLRDVAFIDSWGEEALADLVQRIRDSGETIRWVRDDTRRADFSGVERAFDRRQLKVDVHPDRDSAYAAMGVTS